MGRGSVQEEIRFLMCPELIASLLFTEKLDDLECLVVTGHEQFSTYTGYARNFRFGGNFMDPTQVENSKRKSYLVAIDALCFGRYGQMGDIGDKPCIKHVACSALANVLSLNRY